MSTKEIKFALEVAKLAAKQSNGVRLKVGSVVTDSENNIIAYGYNGDIRGGSNVLENKYFPEDDEDNGLDVNKQIYDKFDDDKCKPYRLVSKDDVIHAEQNVLMHAARRGIPVKNGIMYQTHSPCEHCAALMIQAGIKKVVFLEKFRKYDQVIDKYQHFIQMEQYKENDG